MTDDEADSLSQHLKRAREEAGLSLREVEARSGVSFAHIRRLENGERTPSIEVLQRVAEALSLDLDEVLSAVGIKTTRTLPEPRVYFRRKFGVSEEDAEVMGPVRGKDVAKAQSEIVAIARKLESEGKIVLKSEGDDEYVL